MKDGQSLDSSSFTSAVKIFSNTHTHESCSISNNLSITEFCPRIGVSLETEPSPFYPLLSLPFQIFVQSIYYKVVYHLISSAANFLPFTIPSRASVSRQFLLSHWPRQFLFLFFISSSIILPSHTISSTTAFVFCLSILYAPYFSISVSEMFILCKVTGYHHLQEKVIIKVIPSYIIISCT